MAGERRVFRPGHWTGSPLIYLILLPFLVKLPLILGLLVVDPVAKYAELNGAWTHGVTAGIQTIDANIAVTSHALGSYAAQEWLHGRIPWWNPYEGVGAPLIGEMQSAALFPLTLLLALPQGQLLMHLILQVLAGLFAYGLLRSLRIGRTGAFCGASIFEFNGVFAWLANAVTNPVAFLPLILWGVEWQCRGTPGQRIRGAIMVTLGLSLSLYAGFPEVAYLNGLLVALWTILRLVQIGPVRIARARDIAIAAVAGVLIASPLLVAFAGYLPLADVGVHDGATYFHIDPAYLLMNVFPYWSGGIWTPPFGGDFWGKTGGYAGLVLPVMAVAGLMGRRERGLRVLLGGWILVTFLLSYGATWLFDIVSILPGLKEAAIYRYFPASWIMASCILAAFAIDDLARSGDTRRILAIVGGTVLLWIVVLATAHGVIGWYPRNLFGWLACAVQVALLAAFVALLLIRGRFADRRIPGIALLLTVEAIFLFAVPVMAHRRHIQVEYGSVAFLQRHLGLQRFATLGPIAPNYGTYFRIAQVNHNDLPTPHRWNRFVKTNIDAAEDPIIFIKISSIDEFLKHRQGLMAVGTRYVVAATASPVPGLTPVYRDPVATIYELADPRPYLSAPGCRLDVASRTSVAATCDRDSVLTRLELAFPGWTATIGDRPVAVRTSAEIFQSVALPRGRSVVTFAYAPPYIGYGVALMLLGLIAIVGLVLGLRRQHRSGRAGPASLDGAAPAHA